MTKLKSNLNLLVLEKINDNAPSRCPRKKNGLVQRILFEKKRKKN
jgi:hypothetical protein